jgi:3-oxoacyl-[acyl-carrier protein] reductase
MRRHSIVDLQLAGTNVLVTGAGQGLGRAIGMGFAAEGANVAFHYNSSADGAEQATKAAAQAGVRAIAVGGDVRDAAAVAKMVERTETELGPIGVLVNNAAVTKRQRFLDSTPTDWAAQIDVTVTGTLRVTHAVATRMVERQAGAIVNLMGDSGRVGESGLLVTATTRSTTLGLTRSLAKELARVGIRANAVSLALVRTDDFDAHAGTAGSVDSADERMHRILAQYPLRRLGRPDDVVPMVLLLASPLSSWTTGQVVSVNGGYAMP